MSITDELRTGGIYRFPSNRRVFTEEELTAIADRIDAEHERECKEQYACGVEHGIGASIEASMIQEHGFIELPKDADGEYIHIGDVMDKGKVTCIRDCGKGWEVILNSLYTYDAPSMHHHEPTVEDVLREFAEKVIDSQIPSVHPTYEEAIAEYASRLRLAGDAE